MTFREVALTKEAVNEIMNVFKPSAICTGITWVSVTPTGGVHYTGKRTQMPAVMFEVPNRIYKYIVFALYAYPRGVIAHVFPSPGGSLGGGSILEQDNGSGNKIIEQYLQKIESILKKHTKYGPEGRPYHNEFGL